MVILEAITPPRSLPPEFPLKVVVPATRPPTLTLKVVDDVVPDVIKCLRDKFNTPVPNSSCCIVAAIAFAVES